MTRGLLFDGLRTSRRPVALRRWRGSIRKVVNANRLVGFGVAGGESAREVAAGKAQLRHNKYATQARRLLRECADEEAIVAEMVEMKEKSHENKAWGKNVWDQREYWKDRAKQAEQKTAELTRQLDAVREAMNAVQAVRARLNAATSTLWTTERQLANSYVSKAEVRAVINRLPVYSFSDVREHIERNRGIKQGGLKASCGIISQYAREVLAEREPVAASPPSPWE